MGQESLEEVERPALMVDRKAGLILLACHEGLQERLVGALKEAQTEVHQVAAEELEQKVMQEAVHRVTVELKQHHQGTEDPSEIPLNQPPEARY